MTNIFLVSLLNLYDHIPNHPQATSSKNVLQAQFDQFHDPSNAVITISLKKPINFSDLDPSLNKTNSLPAQQAQSGQFGNCDIEGKSTLPSS